MFNFDDDSPKKHKSEDVLGHGVIATALANCILEIKNPYGNVIAVHGPWGSGKSSVINMVSNEIKELDKSILVIPFNSWCYRTEEGIVSGFFQELYSGIKAKNPKFKAGLSYALKLGIRTTGVISKFGAGLDTAIGPGSNSIFSFLYKFMRRFTDENEKIEDLQKKFSQELEKGNQKILVVVDDIDRLSEEEAIAVFRIIKSVGRLENVLYLLAYDRNLIESIIEKKYPSEKSHYLEKIVQASIDLPEPKGEILIKILNEKFYSIFKEKISIIRNRRLYNLAHDFIAYEIKTVRDVHRLANMLSITFEPIKKDVDLVDFVALETVRLFHIEVYNEIRSHKETLTTYSEPRDNEAYRSQYDRTLKSILAKASADNRDKLEKLLMQIFPILSSIFFTYDNKVIHSWNEKKRVCSALHFDTYFRFSVPESTVSDAEFQNFIENLTDSNFVKEKLTKGLKIRADLRASKSSILLDRVANNEESIAADDVEPFLITLYSISNIFEMWQNSVNEFGHSVNNLDRVIRVSMNLLTKKFDIDRRSKIMLSACKHASLDLLLKLCRLSTSRELMGTSSDSDVSQGWDLMTESDTQSLRKMTRSLARESTNSSSIFRYRYLKRMLFDWHAISENDREVSDMLRYAFEIDENLILFILKVSGFLRLRLSDRHVKALIRDVHHLTDLNYFVKRLKQMIDEGNLPDNRYEAISRVIEFSSLFDLVTQRFQDEESLASASWDPFGDDE